MRRRGPSLFRVVLAHLGRALGCLLVGNLGGARVAWYGAGFFLRKAVRRA